MPAAAGPLSSQVPEIARVAVLVPSSERVPTTTAVSPFLRSPAPEPFVPSRNTVVPEFTVQVHTAPSSLLTDTWSPSAFSTVPRCQIRTIHLPVSWSLTVASPCTPMPPTPNPNRWPPPCRTPGPSGEGDADPDAEGVPLRPEPPEVAA